ncbi:hypothetical protein [Pseudomonas borbori]|uniref:Uncharacterized protein n=1 Tax=Pseudomonas borbori TaxID=289003 RepID=A0A1I5NA38_9PSED|nr:hypothetical protein [Pseudomonas borbori]SFP18718.1 hypothetical protein SAMN05216190_10658 [Pseudomonas borbori]
MVRIRGRVGDWPVDLTVELDAEDWAQLTQHVAPSAPVEPLPVAAPAATHVPADALWQTTLELLRNAGQIEGPQLLGQLAALAGGEAAGKRLLVRLRHCGQVRMETGADAPIYHWVG